MSKTLNVPYVPNVRKDAIIGKDWPELIGQMEPVSVKPWTSPDGERDLLVFFKFSDDPQKRRFLGFGGTLRAAAEKAQVGLFTTEGTKSAIHGGYKVQIGPRTFEFV